MLQNLRNRLFFTRWFRYWLAWQDICGIVRLLYRQDDLENLMDWSRRKKLGVYHFYKKQLFDTEMMLADKQMKFHHLIKWAYLLYNINNLISRSPNYYPQGYAAKYRLR